MQIRQEAAFICKVTTDSKNAAALFDYHAQFLTRAYSMIGCVIYVEAIKGGAVVFYKAVEDFLKFHNFAAQLVPIEVVPSKPLEAKLKTLKLIIEFVNKPVDMSIDQLAELMQKSHRILSPDISVKIKSPKIVVLRYKNAGTLDVIFKRIYEILAKKIYQITPTMK